ncbi:Hypothetical protein FKW44_011996 [Caligus rogercresseyi]|uniref:Uncharacterized protein n=1 Tax=Caligus rogercresseyi TaxID=217165 RepID=A0A7T8HJ47_CALRO|nr:Hypothetical protein FKW44_011996 [Caligus rogercresseyi]
MASNRPTTHGTNTHSEWSWTTKWRRQRSCSCSENSSGHGRIPKAKPQRILATTAGHLSTSLEQGSAEVSPVSYDVLV